MSCICKKKQELRLRRQRAVRARVRGTSDRPRLCVFKSSNHVYCQIIDDTNGTTLVALSTLNGAVKDLIAGKKPVEQAKILGQELAKLCVGKEIKKVAFDRNGFIYHGRVEAVAAGARDGGLEF